MTAINKLLIDLFRGHGIEAEAQGDGITFPGRSLRASGEIVQEFSHTSAMTVQLDVRLQIDPARIIIESFAGLGVSREAASVDAVHNFAANSFHVLLAAFFHAGDDPQVNREEWTIGGRGSRVILSNVTIRGKPPVEGEALVSWYPPFIECIQARPLRPGTHWVQLFCALYQGQEPTCEVRLDNEMWEEVRAEMARFPWPVGPEYYSQRLFLVMDIDKGGTVTPDTAVAWLADIVAPLGEGDDVEEIAYAALAEAGVPPRLADRAFKFTQTAWGRTFLEGMGIQFAPDYLCFDGAGEVVETGKLADDPCYTAALRLVPQYARAPGFLRLALQSADVNAVNQALHAGSKPEDLITSPACMFLEVPDDGAMDKVHEAIRRNLESRE